MMPLASRKALRPIASRILGNPVANGRNLLYAAFGDE
jgi:hypothetical protein